MKPFIVCAVLHQCGVVQVSSSGRVFRDPAGRTVLFQLTNGNKTHSHSICTPLLQPINIYKSLSQSHDECHNAMVAPSAPIPCGSTGSTLLAILRSLLYILLYVSAAITPLHATSFIMLVTRWNCVQPCCLSRKSSLHSALQPKLISTPTNHQNSRSIPPLLS